MNWGFHGGRNLALALGAFGVRAVIVRIRDALHAKNINGDRVTTREGIRHALNLSIMHLLRVDDHTLDGDQALVAHGTAQVLIALV